MARIEELIGQIPDPRLRAEIAAAVRSGQGRTIEIGKEYRLEYEGKMKREQVLADTPAAPWQLVRRFCTERPHPHGWRNLLVWGDNLMALRELLADQRGANRLGTRGKIKLIYIDPPFATKQDFMKDKEKAYRDKVLGAQFIEFLRRRLILLRELLAGDGSIYVHLDTKKGHYIKAVLDEVFGEENFRNEIIWKRQSAHNDAGKCGAIHDTILFYTKNDRWVWNDVRMPVSEDYIAQFFDQIEQSSGRRYARGDLTAAGVTQGGDSGKPWRGIDVSAKGRHWALPSEIIDRHEIDPRMSIQRKLDALDEAGAIHWPKKGVPRLKRYADEVNGVSLQDVWADINLIHNQSSERVGYPTQKPEELCERILCASSNEDDIVLDCFGGSGTTAAVAEKLGRRWIAMDCGKLAIYTTQKRLFSLTTNIGAAKKDDRADPERVEDFADHLKGAPGVLLITEKARRGECEVTLELLDDIAVLAKKHDLVKNGATLSVVCPREKLFIAEALLDDADAESGPGEKQITRGDVEFRLSFIAPKDKTEKEQPLPAKEFALYRAGLYDMKQFFAMAWDDYHPFALKLFGVREHRHERYGMALDGYIATHSALIWNYPAHPALTLDYGYVDDLHKTLRGDKGEKFFIIAPVVAMDFAEDEIVRGGATYIFHKVPLSVLQRLLERKGDPKAPTLKQPATEENVNEVIDAVGFDFITQPVVQWQARKVKDGLLSEYVVELTEFRAKTLATEPEDFANFETFSMAMVDLDYDGSDAEDERAVFRLSRVFWAEELLKAAGGVEKATQLALRIPEQDFTGKKMMVILCDRYGNEKKLVLSAADFAAPKAIKKITSKPGRKK